MPVSVRVPTILRTYTDGESEVSASGANLQEVLDDLDNSYAGIKARILDDNGELRRFVNVYVGNDDVRFLDNLDTATHGNVAVVRYDGEGVRILRNGEIDPESDRRRFSIWISDDADRVPIRLVGKTDYGDVIMDLVQYEPGKRR